MTDALQNEDSAEAFFERCGLPAETSSQCLEYVRTRFPGLHIQAARPQGFCSFTLCVGTDLIVQFRPSTHLLDIKLAEQARRVYGDLAPKTDSLGELCPGVRTVNDPKDSKLYIYSLSRIPGSSLGDFRQDLLKPTSSTPAVQEYRCDAVRELARMTRLSWEKAVSSDSSELTTLKGKVGASMRWRLQAMQLDLPARFRPHAQAVLANLDRIESLPWVLSHGDFIPSNIMVDLVEAQSRGPDGERLRYCGLLDWAEAEYLPLGVGLYGLEELLGESVDGQGRSGSCYPAPESRFVYYDDADELRCVFWDELASQIPQLVTDKDFRETAEQAQILGILLWHGIAFDDGKLDRVVRAGEDDEELQRLDTFLLARPSTHGETQESLVASGCSQRLVLASG